MAKVFVKFVGGERTEVTANTVAEAKAAVNAPKHTALVNGTSASDSQVLKDGQFVTLAEQVKGNAEVIFKGKNVVVTKEGNAFFLNGERLTKKQAEKMATAVFQALGYSVA